MNLEQTKKKNQGFFLFPFILLMVDSRACVKNKTKKKKQTKKDDSVTTEIEYSEVV